MEPQDELDKLPCSDKLTFDTQIEAEASATVAEYRYGSKLKVYQCRHCGLWHIASHYV